jgi:uncharacterized protein YggT (Ycf19 family)
MGIGILVQRLLYFYELLIIAYVIMSWFPVSGVLEEFYRIVASLVEPYVNIFRRIVPVMGGLDFSPFVAILVIALIQRYIVLILP